MLNKLVSEIMTRNPITVSPEEDVVFAFEKLMKHKISAMPVVENDEMIGFITATDLGHNLVLDKYAVGTQVKSIMVKNVVTVSPKNTIKEAIQLMGESAPGNEILNQLPVLDEGNLVGIISDGDIIKLFL